MNSKALFQTFIWCYLVFFSCDICDSSHLIFEEVGQMASALSYIHSKLTVNLSAIDVDIDTFQGIMDRMQKELNYAHYHLGYDRADAIAKANYEMYNRSLQLYFQDILDLQTKMRTLRTMLPLLPEAPRVEPKLYYPGEGRSDTHSFRSKRSLDDVASHRDKRSLLTALGSPLGILGTVFGIYKQYQLDQQLNSIQDQLQRIIPVVNKHGDLIKELQHKLKSQENVFFHLITFNAGSLEATLRRYTKFIEDRISRAFRAFQAAQNRRLAVDFLDATQGYRLFDELKIAASKHQMDLLIKRHSDIFQLELSYLYDGENINMLLHVPMVPADSLLRLFKLHSFPIPLNENFSVLPEVENEILAVSSGYSLQFTATDLLGCNQVNQIYLCERHGILNRNFKQSCLGALYTQDMIAAQRLCRMSIYDSQEVIHQLAGNQYLMYSPEAQTVPISCLDGTQNEVFLQKGIVKQAAVNPGCRASLLEHLVIADYSIRDTASFKYFELSQRYKDHFTQVDDQTLMSDITALKQSGIAQPTLTDLYQYRLEQTNDDDLNIKAEALKLETQEKTPIFYTIGLVVVVGFAVIIFVSITILVYVKFNAIRSTFSTALQIPHNNVFNRMAQLLTVLNQPPADNLS